MEYADDTALMAECMDRILELTCLLAEESQKCGLKINTKKTQIMPVTDHTNRFSAEEMKQRLYIISSILEVRLMPMDLV